MRAIVEVESPSYLLHRAQELLRGAEFDSDNCGIKMAISILALHLIKDDLKNGHTPPGTRTQRGRDRLNIAAKVVKKVVGADPGETVAHPGFDANGDYLAPSTPAKKSQFIY